MGFVCCYRTPPSSQIGTPTRTSNMRTSMSNRETLPPPPPPPVEQHQQQQQLHQQNGYLPASAMNGYAHHDNFQNHMPQGYNNVYDRNHLEILPPPIVSFDQNDEPLPPPPPTPDQNMAAALGMMGHHMRPPSSIPEEHLPPSPPPPPPEDNFPIPVAPPPPPPPPPLPLPNGTDGMDGKPRESRKSPKPAGSESGPKRILPMGGGMMATWDGRSELLKAIRDGNSSSNHCIKDSLSGMFTHLLKLFINSSLQELNSVRWSEKNQERKRRRTECITMWHRFLLVVSPWKCQIVKVVLIVNTIAMAGVMRQVPKNSVLALHLKIQLLAIGMMSLPIIFICSFDM